MKRFYFSRIAPGSPILARILVSGVVEGDTLAAAQSEFDDVLRTRGNRDTHASFGRLDLDEVPDPLHGMLATTMMEQS